MNKDYYINTFLFFIFLFFIGSYAYCDSILEPQSIVNFKKPTYITSEVLELYSNERKFIYKKGVVLKQDDLTITCEELVGRYKENNEIEQLIAKGNVLILKGENIKGSGNLAIYNKDSETITLTQNPELNDGANILVADKIVFYLKNNRTEAIGRVRVKVVNKSER